MGKLDWSQVGQFIGGILDGFVKMSQFFERVFGYGWGYGAFVLLTALVGLVPPIWRWAHLVRPGDGSQGISSDKAEKRTRLHFIIATILCAVIDGYVYAHGGYTYHG